MRFCFLMTGFFLSTIFLSSAVSAEKDPTDQLATRMIELRKEVEVENETYEVNKSNLFERLKALSSQRLELESNLKVENNKNKQIRSKITLYKKQIRKNAFLDSDLTPILNERIHKLKQHIQESLPVKTEERLSAVRDLETRLSNKEIDAVKAANLLWSLIEDEKRLTKENSISRQTILVDNQSFLADVLKLGMMRMYFKIGDKSVGYVTKISGNWVFQKTSNQEQADKIENLFSSFKKQIRQGLFEVPL